MNIKCKIKNCGCYGWSSNYCWGCGKELGMKHYVDYDDGVSNYCLECYEVKNA